ncbi:MAG: homoserine kinase [bacterium]
MSSKNQIQIFSPATVANVSCGYDALGFALEGKGDEMIFKKTAETTIVISHIEGADLPYDPDKNLVGVVAKAMLQKYNADFGLDIQIIKGFKPGSGLGSSAASATGTAFGINELLDRPFTKTELTDFARLGENFVSGSPIADNVAAATFGGFVLIKSTEPLEIVSLPVPKDLFVVALHPQVEIRTQDARKILPEKISLTKATQQWANVGGLISGLYESDYGLISRSLHDLIVEPHRKKLIPHFDEVKSAAIEAGALGSGISGSGPTIFAICKGEAVTEQVYAAMENSYQNTGIAFEMIQSKISSKGVRVIA